MDTQLNYTELAEALIDALHGYDLANHTMYALFLYERVYRAFPDEETSIEVVARILKRLIEEGK